MTERRPSVRAELLCAWRQAGLPDPGPYEHAYDELRAQAVPPPPPGEAPGGALGPATLHSVCGFGYVTGTACARLLGVRGQAARSSVDWCARFNLGISLVDWLCDEAEAREEVAGLPAFALLAGRRSASRVPVRAEARYLDALAHDLLAELARDAGPPAAGEPRSALWPSLRRMLRAELASAKPGLPSPAGLDAALSQLRLTSVEPFRVMAERTLLAQGRRPSRSRIAAARRLGRAIGECVWLVDDAADFWHDLGAGRGNRFVIEAIAADDRVLAADGSSVMGIAMARVLRRERVAERLCARAAGRLAVALRDLPCDGPERERAAGLVGVSLARWTDQA